MHPSLARFIKNFEEEARSKGRYRIKIGHAELLLLEQVWGPVFQYNFEGLLAEYPFIDSKGGERFVDFFYCRGIYKLIIEVDGYTTHARDISPAEFEDHLARQNDLLLCGYLFQTWDIRKHAILQMAARSDGIVRPADVSREFKVHPRTAQIWLKRFMDEGDLMPAGGTMRTTVYKISDNITDKGGKL